MIIYHNIFTSIDFINGMTDIPAFLYLVIKFVV